MTPARPLSRGALLFALALFAAAVWSFHAWWTIARPDRARFTYDSAQYALAGRELATTGRLATPYSYVGPLREGRRPPYALLAGHPLVPMLEAPVFALFGADPSRSIVPVMLAYLVTVLLGALLVLECGGGSLLGAAVGVTLAGSPAMLLFASDGLSEMPFTAAWTGAMLLLVRLRHAPRPVALGILLGLAHLARPVVVPTLPVWLAAAAWAAPAGQRARTAAWILGGFVPLAVLLLLYKWLSTGEPFADVGRIMLLAGLAPEFGAHDVARLLHPPDPVAWIRAHPGALVEKLARNLPAMASQALRLGGWAMGFSFAWAIVRPVRDGLGPLRLVAGGSLGMLAVLCALTLPSSHYLFPMLPVVVALGAITLERVLHSARLPVLAARGLVVVLLLWSSWRGAALAWFSPRFAEARTNAFTEREIAGLGTTLAARLPEGAIVTCDMAPWLSWYAKRPSVNLPLRVADLAELHEEHGISAVVITNQWLVDLPGNEAWREAFLGRAPLPGWTTIGVARSGRLDARVFLPDPVPLSPLERPASPAR
jgi:4-amino-4-deoxy-L-arabinose transferase-like glycosyltransferase